MKEMGCELVETTAHAGARESHAVWQGKVFSYDGKSKKYPDFRSSTGYGTGPGLMGWNCRHGYFPFFEGISVRAYSDKELRELEAHKVCYNGKEYTDYEASQAQRKLERGIRAQKRELLKIDSAMKEAGGELKEAMRVDYNLAAAKLKKRERRLKDFLRQTGRLPDSGRQQVLGFGRSQAQRAVHGAKKAGSGSNLLPNYGKAVISENKLSGYTLNKLHKTGKNKALAFEKALGYNISNKDLLIQQVRDGLGRFPAKKREKTKYGQPFEVSMRLKGPNGKTAKVKTAWIVEEGEKNPRLVSIYVDN